MPTFDKAAGRYRRFQAVTLRASAAHPGGTETTTAIDTSEYSTLDLLLDVTAIAGGGTLTATVQTGDLADGSDAAAVAAFGGKTTVTNERKRFTGLGKYSRISCVLSAGTATYSVTGQGK